jgi:hypothetical protein
MNSITDTEMCEALIALYRAMYEPGCPDAAIMVAMEHFSQKWQEANRPCREPDHISLDEIRKRQRQRLKGQQASLLAMLELAIPDDPPNDREYP